jgi:hypothetical protein
LKKIYQSNKNELVREAIRITKDLVHVVFIGAVAVYLHTNIGRESRDLDFVVASNITNEELDKKKYYIFSENGKDRRYSPRHYKVDIFTDDVNDIPVKTIIQTGVDKKGIKVASLEVLIITKHRASRPSRPQDTDDLRDIASTKYSMIDWEKLRTLVNDKHKFDMIKMTMSALKKLTI